MESIVYLVNICTCFWRAWKASHYRLTKILTLPFVNAEVESYIPHIIDRPLNDNLYCHGWTFVYQVAHLKEYSNMSLSIAF
jgi:hypothetical protein